MCRVPSQSLSPPPLLPTLVLILEHCTMGFCPVKKYQTLITEELKLRSLLEKSIILQHYYIDKIILQGLLFVHYGPYEATEPKQNHVSIQRSKRSYNQQFWPTFLWEADTWPFREPRMYSFSLALILQWFEGESDANTIHNTSQTAELIPAGQRHKTRLGRFANPSKQ